MTTQGVAPKEIIKEDFENFNPPLSGNVDSLLKDALRVLSVEGHSTQGHSFFRGRKFPNTTQLDVAESALGFEKTNQVRERVFEEIEATKDTMLELVNIAFNYRIPQKSQLYNHETNSLRLRNMKRDSTLWGFSQNKDLRIPTGQFEILQALKGAYQGFSMDTSENRVATVKRFGGALDGSSLTIGTGSCHVGDRERLRKNGISLERLANESISPSELEWFYKKHFLVRVDELKETHKYDLFPVYIREVEGLGCCDDATLLGIGLMQYDLGFDFVKRAHILGRNADYVDTFDKITSSPVTGGSDEHIGELINNRYNLLAHKQNIEVATDYLRGTMKRKVSKEELENELDWVNVRNIQTYLHRRTGSVVGLDGLESVLLPQDLATPDEITTAIYFGAKDNFPAIIGSNSVRRFEELNPLQDFAKVKGSIEDHRGRPHSGRLISPGESHEYFLKTGLSIPGQSFFFSQMDSTDFYEIINDRIKYMVELGYFPKPQFK